MNEYLGAGLGHVDGPHVEQREEVVDADAAVRGRVQRADILREAARVVGRGHGSVGRDADGARRAGMPVAGVEERPNPIQSNFPSKHKAAPSTMMPVTTPFNSSTNATSNATTTASPNAGLQTPKTDTFTHLHLGKRNDESRGYLRAEFADFAVWYYRMDSEDPDVGKRFRGQECPDIGEDFTYQVRSHYVSVVFEKKNFNLGVISLTS